MTQELTTSCDLFNAALEAMRATDLAAAAGFLRRGFFHNLYVAPLLLGEECHRQEIWYPGKDAYPESAREYVRHYGDHWRRQPGAISLLDQVWSDSLVRAELRSFINLCKNLLHARDHRAAELYGELSRFLSPKRIERTQSEILSRIEQSDLRLPAVSPRLTLVLLASRDPAASIEFYRRLFGVEPVTTSRIAGGYVEFEFQGLHVAIHGHDETAPGDPYRLGPAPDALGWGALFVVQVADVEYHHERAKAAGLDIVDADLAGRGGKFFVVRDPSGYLFELSDGRPRGLESP